MKKIILMLMCVAITYIVYCYMFKMDRSKDVDVMDRSKDVHVIVYTDLPNITKLTNVTTLSFVFYACTNIGSLNAISNRLRGIKK
jgi:hypothetical protein